MNENSIIEQLTTPLRGEYDVIVCGGGISGVCAAVSAARNGVRVLLIEKSVQLGGLATAGLINWFEPICDGKGKKLMYGMPEELLRLAVRYGYDSLPEGWKSQFDPADIAERAAGAGGESEDSVLFPKKERCGTSFSPAIFSAALDRWTAESGVELLLDTQVVRTVRNGQSCEGVVVENKTGRGFYKTGFVVDAVGDLQVMRGAGAPFENGENYLSYVAHLTDSAGCRQAAGSGRIQKYSRWLCLGAGMQGKGQPEDFPLLCGSSAEEITAFMMAGRKLLFAYLQATPRLERDICAAPSMPQLRKVCRLEGMYTLTEEDCGRHFEDSVGVTGDFLHSGRCYELPLRILYCREYSNMITAGRTVSAAGWTWDVVRVIPAAAATGQAAGMAAAFCVKGKTGLAELSVERLQQGLAQSGVRLHLE